MISETSVNLSQFYDSFTGSPRTGSSISTIPCTKGYIRCRYRSLQHLDNLEIACLQLGSVPMTSLQDMGLDLRKLKSISIDFYLLFFFF